MGRSSKLSKELKVQACEEYDLGKGSFHTIGTNFGVSSSAIKEWYYAYKIHGESAFNTSNRNDSYTKKFKLSLINEYLSGEESLRSLGAKHNISIRTITKWVNNYYNGIEPKDYDPKGEAYTMKSRKTTFEERLEIVKWVLNNNMNYKEVADKNGVKYALVYQWVKKYLKDGEEGLKYKKRGSKEKAVIDDSTLSEIEKLKLELEREKALRERAEFRLELFKKKEEFAQRRHSQK